MCIGKVEIYFHHHSFLTYANNDACVEVFTSLILIFWGKFDSAMINYVIFDNQVYGLIRKL